MFNYNFFLYTAILKHDVVKKKLCATDQASIIHHKSIVDLLKDRGF